MLVAIGVVFGIVYAYLCWLQVGLASEAFLVGGHTLDFRLLMHLYGDCCRYQTS